MTKYNFKLTDQAKRELKKIAQTLPPTFQRKGNYVAVEHTGFTNNQILVGKQGEFIQVDHYKNICSLYRMHNDPKLINEYVAGVNSIITPRTNIGYINGIKTEVELITERSRFIQEGEHNNDLDD
jgi:hypothetical protein